MEIEKTDLLLTIAIPTYNRKNLLKRALESIVPQLSSKIEVLVSDNASNDGTNEMIAKSFPMVRYFRSETNKGADYNFLQCYRKAKGKYVILFGSDDRFTAGALDYLTDYLEKSDCDLVFMNYRYYDVAKEIYIRGSERIKNYDTKQDVLTNDRNLFMRYANHGITFMSASIAKRVLLSKVSNPERFIGTYFIHTYIMLESVKGKQASFGVIMQPLVDNCATEDSDGISHTSDIFFTVFGKCMYHVLCIHAVKCNFQKRRMENVYLRYLHDYPFWRHILSLKGQNEQNAKVMDDFWENGYPVVKHFPTEWIKVMAVILTPQCFINVLYKVYKSFRKSK